MEVKGFSSLKEGRGWYLEACKYTGSSGRAGPDLTASAGGKRWRDGKDKGSAIQMICLYFYCTYEGLVWSCVLFMLSSCQQALFYARNETEPRFLLPNDSLVLPTAVWSGRSGLPRLLVKVCGLQLLHLDAFISFFQGSRLWALTFLPPAAEGTGPCIVAGTVLMTALPSPMN